MENTSASGFVLLSDVIPDAILDIRYYTTFNFIGERVDGYEEPVALLTKEAAEALKKANEKAMALGYRLKIFDCYRPQMAVDHFIRWAEKENVSLNEANIEKTILKLTEAINNAVIEILEK